MWEDEEKLLEHLFLLEVLVEKLMMKDLGCGKICPCERLYSPDPNIPFRVRIKFINFPCFEINQEEFGIEPKKLEALDAFRSGKSCLFPMAPLDLLRAVRLHPLAITVFQRDTETSPAQVLGVGRVMLSQGMNDAIRRATECSEDLPLSSTLTGTFPLTNPKGKDAGRIRLFVRLSCFGQSIVTQFQLVGEDKSYLFKNSRADTAFQCKKCVNPSLGNSSPFRDVIPAKAFICSSQENFMEHAAAGDWMRDMDTPEALAASCDCDVYKQRAGEPQVSTVKVQPLPETETEPEVAEVTEEVERPPAAPWLPDLAPQNPPVRYNTTGALSPAFEGRGPLYTSHPPVRYDTTGALSPAFQDVRHRAWPPHPPVRYDTTSALSPAFEGHQPLHPEIPQHPPVRYDTTGSLSGAFMNPPIRYDTTGALSPAFQGKPELITDISTTDVVMSTQTLETLAVNVPPVTHSKNVDHLNQHTYSSFRKPAPTFIPPATFQQYGEPPDFSILKDKEVGKKIRIKKPKRKKKVKPPCPLLVYPTVRRGHKHCLDLVTGVPKRMGWLWNVQNLGLQYRPGWRPGAVTRPVSRIIRRHHAAAGILEDAEVKVRKRKKKNVSSHSFESVKSVVREIHNAPTLVVQKHKGEFFVTMKPLQVVGEIQAEPIELRVPTDISSTSSGSGLEIEFLAPGAFPPSHRYPVLKNRETQVYTEQPATVPPPPSSEKHKKGKGKGKGKHSKKSITETTPED